MSNPCHVHLADLATASMRRGPGESELARTERHVFHLVVNRLAPWRLVQEGRVQLRPGDAVLMDSTLNMELTVGTYELINITMPVEFVNQWLPDATALRSRRLDRDGR
jgi:hypothetical protein